MAQLTLTEENLPSPEIFELMLKEAIEQSTPLDELLELTRELYKLEREFGMKSTDFYEKYRRGEMGNSEEVIHWAIVYQSFLERKKRVQLGESFPSVCALRGSRATCVPYPSPPSF